MKMIQWFTSVLLWPVLRIGGGGGGAPADTETPRRRAAIERINTLFGIGDPNIDRSQFESVSETGGIDTPVFSSTSFDEAGYRKALEQAASERSDRAAARELGYTEHAGNVENLQRSQVDKDYEEAARQLKMALARRGLTGSSVQSDQGGLLGRRRQEGYLSAGQAGERAAEGLRAADERSRLSLIDQINAGLDTDAASTSLLSNIDANRRAAGATDLASRINNFFQGIGAIYENQALPGAIESERRRRQPQTDLASYLDPTRSYAGS
jgi:hypothetical protein